jgi:glycosyltransferase involved in cell wall biosynthesis
LSDARRRTRIVLVAPYPPRGEEPQGGVQVTTVRLAAALANEHDVTVVSPGAPGGRRDGEVSVLYAGEADHPLALARSLRPWRRAVARILAELEPDVVHAQGLLGPGVAATDAVETAIVTAHGNVANDVTLNTARLSARLRASAVRRLATLAARRAHTVVGVHPDWRVNVPVEPKRFVHIPNMVDERFYGENDAAGRTSVVLYCGGTRRIKGWDVLAAAWPDVARALPEARLHVLGWSRGHDPWRGLERVRVETWLEESRVAEAMATAAAVVVPSRFEVAPLTLYEAWASGTPVVASAGGGLASLAEGAATLVPVDDAGRLTDALVEVLTDPNRAAAGVAAGRVRAQAARPGAVVAAHRSLYRSLPR